MVEIESVTAAIFLIWTNVAWTNVAWTNVIVIVGICVFPGTYLSSFINIRSVTAEILLSVSFCGRVVRRWWGMQSHFHV